MITVHLPFDLADEFHADSVVTVQARSCAGILEMLNLQYPGMASWLAEPDGRFRVHLSVFVSGRRLPTCAHVSEEVADGSEVWILKAISGG
ncbi:MoaD/ThiS family protein [Ferroacidibacillus organovorans]|uniref:Molybdopterin synthase sulfur carrier subunit n=1 Tax=Ferroacidibacillus organovorans TaxID=1765683 RepID=A0A162U0W0_9BACL|nr:MoaD/ThiS family protein [Ferroacidibacillus organovorans]KYP81312.1 hypothetical protein AYJ22_07855 [Ferroacidibacillus organovorans]OAG95291.1 hypothetical protein AYW79_01075 [Ferroacidibacillus organovorans]OPG17165.1 hypothetical protein B2M26_02175 [Ferroacidibacillus organovorans]